MWISFNLSTQIFSSFFGVKINVFHQILKDFSLYFLKYVCCSFLSFPTGTPIRFMLMFLKLSCISGALLIFLYSFFPLYSLGSIFSIYLSSGSLIFSCSSSNLLVNSSKEFSILFIWLFDFTISIWLFKKIIYDIFSLIRQYHLSKLWWDIYLSLIIEV